MAENLVPPTDEFIESIAKKYGMTYTKGKKGEDRFYSDDDEPIYPLNDGFIGEPKKITLKAGSIVLDRYGGEKGTFVATYGTALEMRALPRGSRKNTEYHIYIVTEDLEGVFAGKTAPWFNQKGGGMQFKLPDKIVNLKSHLQEVFINDV